MIQAVPLSAIRIVLVEPSHPGNIGAVARAMKNMALDDLVLVRPKAFPHDEATARASGADDLLARARVVESVTEAVADVGFVAATTSRPRDQNFRALDLHEAAQRIFEMSARGPAAVLFGAERTGLTNEELALAHLLIRIPANPDYPSLNLAMAVQLLLRIVPSRGQSGERAPAVRVAGAAGARRRHGALLRAPAAGHGRSGFQGPHHRRHASHDAHPPPVPALRDGPERSEHPARLPDFRAAAKASGGRAQQYDPARTQVAMTIYLDYAATTPVDPRVAAAMADCLTTPVGAGRTRLRPRTGLGLAANDASRRRAPRSPR